MLNRLVKKAYLLATIFTGLLFLENAAAHGGEPTEGLSNLQITLISLGLSVASFFTIPKLWESKINRLLNCTGMIFLDFNREDIS